MGSPYLVVLTTLTGYSDDLFQWYCSKTKESMTIVHWNVTCILS